MLGTRWIDDSERGVAGFRQLSRDLDNALEQGIERQLGGESDAGVE
jgi:hypothetical protein